MSSSMTKEELRSALIAHGVKSPPSSAKKDELISLYEEHVAPINASVGDFSDDEITISPRKKGSQSSAKSATSAKSSEKSKKGGRRSVAAGGEESSLVVGDVDVDQLDDDQLFQLLQENGINVGPIVDSTRPFYKKKLALVLKGESGNLSNGSTNGNEYSDTEPEEDDQPSAIISPSPKTRVSNRSKVSSSSKKSASPTKASLSINDSSLTGLRKRLNLTDEVDAYLTPTPRRSIHSYKVTETTKQTIVRNKDGEETKDTVHTIERTEDMGREDKKLQKPAWQRYLPLLILLLCLAGLSYYLVVVKGVTVSMISESAKNLLPAAGGGQQAAPAAAAPKAAPTAAPKAPPPTKELPVQEGMQA